MNLYLLKNLFLGRTSWDVSIAEKDQLKPHSIQVNTVLSSKNKSSQLLSDVKHNFRGLKVWYKQVPGGFLVLRFFGRQRLHQ